MKGNSFLLLVLSFLASSCVIAQKKIITTSYQLMSFPLSLQGENVFCPVVIGEDELVFITDTEFDLLNQGENNWKKRKRLNIFSSRISVWNLDTIQLEEQRLFGDLFLSNSHSGPISITTSGNFAAFNRVEVASGKVAKEADVAAEQGTVNWKKLGEDDKHFDRHVKLFKPQIYFSNREEGKWIKPKPFEYNDPSYILAHPAISGDGSFMVFSSDIPGGKGGKELFVTRYDGSGWSVPELLDFANSPGNEQFPTIVDSVLYFSSDRSGGMGGLDLYKVDLSNPAEPEHLGDQLNSSADDFGMSIFPGGKLGLLSSNRRNGNNDEIFVFQIIETVTIESKEFSGEFRFRNIKGQKAADMHVVLLDDEGNVVFQTQTDENGRFLFRNLSFDENYRLQLKEGSEDMELIVFNKNGEVVAYLLSNSNGEFIYKRMSQAEVGTLSLIDPEDVDPTLNQADLSGQFVYEHLKGKQASGLKVMLVDEEGNIMQTTTTDDYGNFTFRKLNMDENYLVQLGEEDGELALLIFNNDNKVTAMLRMGEDGTYTYRKLKAEYKNDLAMIDLEDESMLEDITAVLEGQFSYRSLKNDFGNGLEFQIIDENGSIVMEAVTTKDGFFRLQNLPLTESYLIKVNASDFELEDMQLTILSRFGKKVALLDKDKDGYFVYTPLGLSGGVTINQLENTDKMEVVFKNEEIPIIYFGKNSSFLNSESKRTLKEIAARLKSESGKKVEVSSYASSTGTEDYNLKLSQRRTESVIKYLKALGVPSSKINGNAYGEGKLLNDCSDDADCPEELHRLNRRSEFRIY